MRSIHRVLSKQTLFRSWLVVLLAALAPGTAVFAATLTVNTVVDDDLADGECSLREAILAANTDAPHNDCPAGAGPDRIVFTLAKGSTILLGSSLPTITATLALRGPGAALLTIDGQDLYAILRFDPPASGNWLGVEELTLRRGFSESGGGGEITGGQNALLRRVVFLANRANNGGGGLLVSSSAPAAARVEILECWFADNQGLGPSGGGGLWIAGPGIDVSIDRTTFSGNLATAAGGVGGGLRVSNANVQIQRSTLSGNGASDSGGGIVMSATSDPFSVSVRDSTLTANRANDDGDADGEGGGIAVSLSVGQTATLEVANSILAGNVDSGGVFHHPDASIPAAVLLTLTSSGFNVIGSNEGAESFFAAGAPNADGDYVGTAAAPIDPALLALADNGGFGPDHRPALIVASPLIDQGFCPGSPADQRGYGDAVNHLRIVDTAFANGPGSDGCDIGAHERAGDPGADPAIFSDGFEWGHTLLWSTEVL